MVSIDLPAAVSFLATHGRLLDRRRLALLLGTGGPEGALAALDGYRNPDGGYGWGLEADLRTSGSQPGAALHAFEVFAEIAPVTSPRAAALCDWLDEVSHADGGLPFALPIDDPAGCAPFFVRTDPAISSLQITSAVAAQAHWTARHDPAVARHPWLDRATRYCATAVAALTRPHAYELSFALQLADAVAERDPAGKELLERLARLLPPNAAMHVSGGTDAETLHPLDFSPWPDRPVRQFVASDIISADLNRLALLQQPDGGWTVDFVSSSPAAALEWRGYMTVRAIAILRAHAA